MSWLEVCSSESECSASEAELMGCSWAGHLSYPWIRPSPAPTSDYLSPPQIAQTTRFTLGPILGYSDYHWSLTSVPPRITWISRTIQSLGLSMTFYGLPHLGSIVLLSCHSLNLTCTRLALRSSVYATRIFGYCPHSFPQILYLAVARTSTFSKHDAFSLRTLPFYYTI